MKRDRNSYIAGFNDGYEAAKPHWFTVGFCVCAAIAVLIVYLLR